ncbi:hypothetical protein Ddye_025762 [Dipteronia dyeriana]|uniref:RNase H type-1 domain-containing protein n=1 Tax=Dipteronia dyeriana TaxID=168575 RepID=A0AAD9WPR6_9ROSI|nr:hypothetical protein Ddye_025762 [Dipteronia dyeriana]
MVIVLKVLSQKVSRLWRNGHRIRLWNDIYMDSFPLLEAFPKIYTLASNKEGMFKDFRHWENSKWLWVVNLRWPLFDWEVNHWNGFMVALDSISVRSDIEDSLAWSFASNGLFIDRCVDNVAIKVKKEIEWVPPVGSVLCFNVDGSSKGNPRDAGIGGVLRDSMGKVLCLFSYYVGVEDANTAEALAIHRAYFLISSNSCFV